MSKFRKLDADEIECRIAEIDKNGRGLFLLLYKTARTDAALLDETVGWNNWQCDFKSIDGKLFCGIGIKTNDEWIWKWDCGSESNIEPEKGLASDAFKRSGFKWGVGAELYSSPRIKIYSEKCNIKMVGDKPRCYDQFKVQTIGYDDNGKINRLTIWNDTKCCVAYEWKSATNV